ncbi:phosphonate ABC transporter, permease protein PhnE [Vulcanibacillus modesticaldus]|uniref:Phosphonate ABC transporter, permease protein PhnE n=1 Tax=Vulcanibacillus modesticaldus TaxID=337097 RepID=A0A1D2YVD7_9BACI|nr:phosphonate ABC transporter, permease protein PhnE [Vulcanibacillus modesticaldus]OEF99585.1 phosphonate ABC transporter, permease protein PhnE [Vulcanibacillus modesticaldus]
MSWRTFVYFLLIIVAIFFSIKDAQLNFIDIKDISNTIEFLGQLWPFDYSMIGHAISETLITMEIAFLGTFFGLIIAFPLAFLAAINTSPNLVIYNGIRTVLTFLRSIPELVLALIFVPTFGLTPLTVIIAIFIHNIAVLGKLISELIESVDPGPQEAVASTGARKILLALYGVVPQIIPNVLSHYFYRFEVGIRSSILFGAIGAGGIGDVLFLHFKTFQYSAAAVDVLIIMLIILIVDYIGVYLRSRVI